MRARRAQGGHELSPNARQAALSCSSFASPAAAANSSMGYAFGHVPGRSDADPNNLVVLIPFFGFIIAGGVFLYRWLKKKKFSDLKIAIVLWYAFPIDMVRNTHLMNRLGTGLTRARILSWRYSQLGIICDCYIAEKRKNK
jgi:hypothetical protein